MNNVLRYAILIFFSLLFSCITEEPTEHELTIGDPLPSFSVVMNNGETMGRWFAKQGIPRIYIIDAAGIIRKIFTDQSLATYEELTEAISE